LRIDDIPMPTKVHEQGTYQGEYGSTTGLWQPIKIHGIARDSLEGDQRRAIA
jgi:hypothetical protein